MPTKADGSKTQRLSRRASKKKSAPGRSVSLLTDEAALEAVIDNLPVALFAKDVSDDFRFVLWNKKQEEITTIRKEKALGKTDFDIFSEDSAEYFREIDKSVLKRGKLVDVPEEIVDTVKGGEIWLHTVKVPIEDKVTGRSLLIGISEDITERVEARAQLEKLNRNLTEKNKELREIQLQLIQAEKAGIDRPARRRGRP